MLPLIDDLNATKVVKVPPPTYFKAPVEPTKAWFTEERKFICDKPTSSAKKSGLAFEKKFLRWLQEDVQGAFIHRWICFQDATGLRWCQPDFLIPGARQIIIGEVKLQHMPEAYWQLKELYEPVVRLLFPDLEPILVEVVKSYDPSVPFPCRTHLIAPDGKWDDVPRGAVGVFVWKP